MARQLNGPARGLGIDAHDDARTAGVAFLDNDGLRRGRVDRERESGKEGHPDESAHVT